MRLQDGIVHLVDGLRVLRRRRNLHDAAGPRARLGDVLLVELGEGEVAPGWGDEGREKRAG